MERTLVTVIPELTEAQKQNIRKTAEGCGIHALFFDTSEAAAEAVRNAEIIFAFAPELAKEAKNLRWYATPSAGVDRFLNDEALTKNGVILTNGSGAYGTTIAEHIIMVILMIYRREKDYTGIVQRHEWIRNLPMRSISGSRITLLGTGDIGQCTAKRLGGFEPASLIGVNRSGTSPASCFDTVLPSSRIEEVLPETDILILSLPKTEETYHILDRKRLALLKDGALVVNAGRGSCIEEEALIEELKKKRLYAALDVFETEPLPASSPLWELENALLTPHVAGDMSLPLTVETVTGMFLSDLQRYAKGEALRKEVSRKKGY